MVFNPRTYEPPDGSVTTAKIAANAVTTAKLADAAVTIAKSVLALGRKDTVGSEVDLTHLGVARKRLERIRFVKSASNNLKALLIVASVKRGAGAGNATLEAWIDNDADWDAGDLYTGAGAPPASAITTSAAYELKELSVNVSALAVGMHVVNLAAVNADATTRFDSDFRNYFVDPQD